MELTARAKFIRIAPDKIRNLSSLVKGKKLTEALIQLQFSGKAASKPLILVLKQAVDQAKDKDMSGELTVKSVQVNEGPKLKRRRIRQQGRSTQILKRGSHIILILTNEANPKSKILNSKKKNQKSLEIKNSDLEIKATEGSA